MDNQPQQQLREGPEPVPAPDVELPADDALRPAESPVCYHQNCPVCGRNLRIRVRLLGRRVYCQHCGGGFIASDVSADGPAQQAGDRPRASIVDELIERATVMLTRSSE